MFNNNWIFIKVQTGEESLNMLKESNPDRTGFFVKI